MENNELPNPENVIKFQVNRYKKYSPFSYKELYQIGYLGYLEAQKNCNQELGAMTLTYATMYIKNRIERETKKELAYQRKVNLDPELEIVEDVYNPINAINDCLDCLTPFEEDVIRKVYLDTPTLTMEQIGALYNVTKQYISKVHKKAVRKIKHELRKT